MVVFIKTLTGKTITLEIESSDTIRTVKEKISAQEGISIEEQKLMYRGNILKDEFTLASIRIEDNTQSIKISLRQIPRLETSELNNAPSRRLLF